MISKNKIKFLRQLQTKKYRNQHKLFICEGVKVVEALLKSSFEVQEIFVVDHLVPKLDLPQEKTTIVSEAELKKISVQKSPQGVLALVRIPDYSIENQDFSTNFTIVLDRIQDPGNLGTIIRIADWFGIEKIICSHGSVDLYNPKVIQSAMGAIFNVKVFYTCLEDFLTKFYKKIPVYGTFMDGEDLKKVKIQPPAFILFGNEANGIAQNLHKFVSRKVSVPPQNPSPLVDSLNVAVSAGIVLSHIV